MPSRTCSRCGTPYRTAGREYTCGQCSASVRTPAPTLSPRESQIVALLPRSNKEIAHELCLTPGTVKEYMFHIFRKLGVSNRTELALWGRDRAQHTLRPPDSSLSDSTD